MTHCQNEKKYHPEWADRREIPPRKSTQISLKTAGGREQEQDVRFKTFQRFEQTPKPKHNTSFSG